MTSQHQWRPGYDVISYRRPLKIMSDVNSRIPDPWSVMHTGNSRRRQRHVLRDITRPSQHVLRLYAYTYSSRTAKYTRFGADFGPDYFPTFGGGGSPGPPAGFHFPSPTGCHRRSRDRSRGSPPAAGQSRRKTRSDFAVFGQKAIKIDLPGPVTFLFRRLREFS